MAKGKNGLGMPLNTGNFFNGLSLLISLPEAQETAVGLYGFHQSYLRRGGDDGRLLRRTLAKSSPHRLAINQFKQ
jgi:hypothetical protein